MIPSDTEIEIKLLGDNINVASFVAWCQSQEPKDQRDVEGPDHYYRSADRVVRHRIQQDGHHELTVKLRKSGRTTRNRFEIDLPFNSGTPPKEVAKFLVAIGFEKEFTLTKKAHIFEFQRVIVAIYNVHKDNDPKWSRFVEVEARKGENITPEHGEKLVGSWTKKIAEKFGVENIAINDSLYEIYSGRKYLSV